MKTIASTYLANGATVTFWQDGKNAVILKKESGRNDQKVTVQDDPDLAVELYALMIKNSSKEHV